MSKKKPKPADPYDGLYVPTRTLIEVGKIMEAARRSAPQPGTYYAVRVGKKGGEE